MISSSSLLLFALACYGYVMIYSEEPQPANNKYAALIEQYGEEGYKRIVRNALHGTSAASRSWNEGEEAATVMNYGVDTSWPIHHESVTTNYPWLPHNGNNETLTAAPSEYEDMPIQPLGDRQSIYDSFLQGCKDHFGSGGNCESTERTRLDLNLRQPASVRNYTDLGFRKIRTPSKAFKMLQQFWEDNKHSAKTEEWPGRGYTYTNNWIIPSQMLSVEDASLKGGGAQLRHEIWNAAKDTVQQWTGQKLRPTSLYGIRIYKEGALLAPHVDRMPLVSSGIINVAQDVDEEWPLEVYAHDGKVYNVTMQPGDMVLYESHSILHGRPFALKGRFYANVFVHFEPFMDETQDDIKFLLDHNTKETHAAAALGDLTKLSKIADIDPAQFHQRDENGWLPIHEAVRSGFTDVVQLFLDHGVDPNAFTNYGSTPLDIATESGINEDHDIVKLLKKYIKGEHIGEL
mmetsp:Transcript_35256/g.51801  ORF Transcript_35256/g.51801 Transcript_35256/m.51801 type:complete len:460 (+) Transcript_35256:63-1442(+)|eukprot:CAMPEP_0195524344 /NCGR_PEP_ID=MMETSP0794_2-20130614/24115_1 /TAXON_ID=515487 /ORGANISM="Stephanopyxis turris, Strain CCMP 815" /LENGTH=459 /DNA_ID=CAMNT_0040654545 /DNA_START=61 /DNA_END=1440 /DNA_ORIENTATION=+